MDLATLWLIAVSMAAFTAWLLKRGSTMKTLNDASILLFLLTMMATMFVSAVVYLYYPGFTTLILLVAFNMVTMSVFLIPVLMALFFGDRPLEEIRKGSAVSTRTLIVGSVIALVVVSEVFMGWTFAIVTGAASTSAQSVLSSLVDSMGTYWFIFTMAGEMAVTLYLVGRNFPSSFRWLVAIQTVIMVTSPTAINNATWSTYTLAANSGVMILAIIFMMEYIFKNRTLTAGASNYLIRLMGAYALMMAGLFVWVLYNDVLLFVISIVAEMVVYFSIVLDEKQLVSTKLTNWQSRPFWTFGLLFGLFVAEFFMGGVLDMLAFGTSYFSTLPFVAMTGSAVTVLGAAFYNFVIGVVSITASFWFLVMMGIEMGALVVFKIRYAREMETKVRLLLVIAAYAIYALFLPTFIFSNVLPNTPWIGWSMGIGTAGAIGPGITIVALLATYLISGGLSFLFGSRNVCSVFCTAALMYQGTTYYAMSSFNRTSTVGRHLLTSRISDAYKIVVTLIWASLLGSAALSYLTSIGVINISFFGLDPSYFFYAFYFDVLWYVVWFTIPFLGTYACSTTGMCGWGSFNQLVSRFGMFRLKVRSSNTCVDCKTKDCALVCPVGLTDMPGAFIHKGEFKSYKCIGVGDCVSACPYQNISFFDVRNWLRTKLNLPLPQPKSLGLSASGSPLDFRLLKNQQK